MMLRAYAPSMCVEHRPKHCKCICSPLMQNRTEENRGLTPEASNRQMTSLPCVTRTRAEGRFDMDEDERRDPESDRQEEINRRGAAAARASIARQVPPHVPETEEVSEA